jgi:hypothetical protein
VDAINIESERKKKSIFAKRENNKGRKETMKG